MTLYEALLFVHILGAMVWVGGSIMLSFISARVERSGDTGFRARFATAAGVVGPVIGASSGLVLAAGIGMVLESDAVRLSQPWVWLGVAGFALSGLLGAYFGPASKRMVAALEAGNVAEADRQAKTFNLMSKLSLLLLILIVADMVFKPGV
jgi:uncharacterized membrane protein